ncbi:hypothetical protein SAMN04488121_102398 [Chitinophaga filiformis]|uniref:Uncharacterized protein n=2 Tax=Chitinophaga filiformis TaxID=104663 RepID=A0A1G7MGB3_CHIFI|nr:hypothetical protein SAMN04488121_102398 [Chitinophaga filiformis]
MEKQELYVAIWKKALPDMLAMLEIFPHHGAIEFPSNDFFMVGDRQDYSFNLQIDNGKVVKISNSTVARDLADVFTSDVKAMIFAYDKKIVIKLNKNFTLHLSAER